MSIGFVGVIVSTVGLLRLFPLVLLCWVVAVVVTGAVLVRIPPLSTVPEEYVVEPEPETAFRGSPTDYVRFAFGKALDEARHGRILPMAVTGLVDGLKVTALTLGTVVTISTATLLLIAETNVFRLIAAPLAPVVALL
ncbi:YjiH family protein, partial [Halobium palmae]